MRFGQTVKTLKPSLATEKSMRKLQRKSSDGLEKHVAKVTRDGKYFIITFAEGRVTQGRSRPEALVMAADMWACLDDRDASHYYARWDAGDRISVISLP